ncbi:hypothetical protein niasHT_013506 [Heterodera trifolii]|uniref:Lipocalin domain-containing protein n=1 Tax=Heterodera trifolii TaxID=157864 RepID=A0ABD2LCW5_9BILA
MTQISPLIFFCFFLLDHYKGIIADSASSIYGGIPVPGRRVPAIRMFQLFLNTCRSSPTLEKLSKLIQNVNADQIAEKLQRNLYFAVDDVNVNALMGKWHTVIYSPLVQSDYCAISYYELLDQSIYSSIFTTVQYSLKASDSTTNLAHGTGQKYGPEPGSLLIVTGQPNEPCPYFPVKVGPIGKRNGQYAYLVLTQALKQPTTVLARDPKEFDELFREEVVDYLRRFGYWQNALMGSELKSANWTKCDKTSPFFAQIEMEGTGDGEKAEGQRNE